MKIKNRSRKGNHKRDGNGVARIGTFPFNSDPAYDSVVFDLVKPGSRRRKQKRKDKPITMHVSTLCDWFSSFASPFDLNNLVFTWS